jgi:Raf kinase inhibitor-like YbhB/YbcL family protein
MLKPHSAQSQPRSVTVKSPALEPGRPMPRQYTADGQNISPPLTWMDVPSTAKQLVVTCQDDDEVVPLQSPFLHWVVYNMPATARGLPEGVPWAEVMTEPPNVAGAFQAYTAFSYPGYRGPQPLPGQLHHYRFTVYAIDTDLQWKPSLFANAVLTAIKGHVIGQGEIAVTYTRELRPR